MAGIEMTFNDLDCLGFSAESAAPIRYIERTHRWYTALGYGEPYRYAQYAEVPFTPLATPF
jgi:D-proline reductase (dithiol) PrdB